MLLNQPRRWEAARSEHGRKIVTVAPQIRAPRASFKFAVLAVSKTLITDATYDAPLRY